MVAEATPARGHVRGGGRRLHRGAEVERSGDGGHAFAVDDEDHVVAVGRERGARGRLHGQRAGARREGEGHEVLRHVALMRVGAERDEVHGGDRGGVRRFDRDRAVVGGDGGHRGDRRTGSLEEVGRRVHLRGVLAGVAETRGVAAAGDQHAAVGHQDRRRVVVARRRDRRGGRPSTRFGVPDFRGQDARGDHLLVAVRVSADSEDGAVGEHRQRVVDAAVSHFFGRLPFGSSAREVDRRGGRRRARFVGDARRAARVEDPAGAVHDRGAVDDTAGAADRSPRFGARVQLVGVVLGGADREDVAVRKEVGEGVLFLVHLGGGDFREQRPFVGGRVVDLGRVRPRGRVLGVAADRDVASVRELCDRGVPARDVHVRERFPFAGGWVVGGGAHDPVFTF